MNLKNGYVYILTNKNNSVLYVGVTSNLRKRIYEHKNGLTDSFSKKYNAEKLVYYEVFESVESAILREKQLKAGSRKKKLDLVLNKNPRFEDLYQKILL